jgi:pimeloyl-ACP methyl ester carboxylesterase
LSPVKLPRMNHPRGTVLALAAAALVLLAAACGEKDDLSGETDAVRTAVASEVAGGASPSPTQPAATPTPGPPRKLGTSTGVAHTSRAPDFEALAGATAYSGELGNAVFRIEVPADWNGELVLWAHGYRGPGTEVYVDNPPGALRRAIIDDGFAWAASSYSENGYAPGIGADDTLALKDHFEAQIGPAERTYLVGASMGGHVVTLSLEHFPDEYDGALAVCGALAGEEIIDYLFSWNLAAEYVTGVEIPTGNGAAAMVGGVLAQFTSMLGPIEAPTQRGEQFESIIRMNTGGPRPFFEEGFREQYGINFAFLLLDAELKSLPARAATNDYIEYEIEEGLGLTSEEVNEGIRRLSADPDARDAEAHPDAVPTSGRIDDPLLTLHNTGDLFVPISMEQSYRRKVEEAGKGDLLVQRIIRAGGHCKFSEAELQTAWDDLVEWVETGDQPAGDDVLGDLSDAGREFTTPLREGDPGTK